jgi:hypothetical protein
MNRNFLESPVELAPFGRGNINYHRNLESTGRKDPGADQTTCCVVCGRKTNNNRRYVCLTDGGEYIAKENLTDDDLGFYPVGSDCAKKLQAGGND